MNKNNEQPIKIKENYFVHATIKFADFEIDNLPCKIFLPDKTDQKPFLKFKPTKEQYYKILSAHEGSFEAEVIGFDGQKEVSIFAPIVYFSDFKTNYPYNVIYIRELPFSLNLLDR